ncbi:MAG: hypothetical protein RAO92_02045 [Candidatus Euphemobacter frigidus]|nr:hypothetical protein [Candidatus Euphemobacter frigidus]
MNNTKHAVMISLFASMQSGAKHYTKASAHRIRELLAEYHGIQIQRRWLFYCLADAEGAGLIRRKTRYRRQPDGTFVQLSSMVSFTLAGVKYLVQKKVAGALELLKRMLAFLSGKDKRWPKSPDVAPKWTPEEMNTSRRRMIALVENLR